MDKQARLRLKYQQFTKALSSLNEFKGKESELNDLEIDGLIHRAKLEYHLSLNLMHAYLENLGFSGINSPKSIIKKMMQLNIIEHEAWNHLSSRNNNLNEVFEESRRGLIFKSVKSYVNAFQELKHNLELHCNL